MDPHLQSPSLTVRQLKVDFDAITQPHWFGDNPYLTHFLTAVFQMFPDGEPFTVDAVKTHLRAVTDPELRETVKAFIVQEANHGKMHEEFFVWLDSRSVSSKQMRAKITKEVDAFKVKLAKKPMNFLSAAVAAEHFAAVVGAGILRSSALAGTLSPSVRALTLWHAIEEVEHRSVAFDVYTAVGGTYWRRALDLAVAVPVFAAGVLYRQMALVIQDGQLWNLQSAWQTLRILIGPGGFFTSILPSFLDYFRRDFHPSQHASDELIAAGMRQLEQLATVKSTKRGRREQAGAA